MTVGSVITAMIDYLHGNLHDVEHLLKVYGYAKAIGEEEGLDPATQRTLEIAAVVHDIGIPLAIQKYGSDAGPYQEELGPAEARKLLGRLGCDGSCWGCSRKWLLPIPWQSMSTPFTMTCTAKAA